MKRESLRSERALRVYDGIRVVNVGRLWVDDIMDDDGLHVWVERLVYGRLWLRGRANRPRVF
jgi:hypothetical protein